jgi:ABC-2 type transport system permease protein
LRAFGAMVVANFKMMVRNRQSLFWMLAFPIMFMMLFGYLLNDNSVSLDIGVVGADSSPIARQITDQLKASGGFKVTTGDKESELKKLEQGKRSLVIVFGPGTGESKVAAQLFYDQTNPTQGQLALSSVSQFLSQANASLAGGPPVVEVQTQGVATHDVRYIDFLVPGVLAMAIMNNGMVGLSFSFVIYRERGILRRIKATPFPLSSFILARILTQVLIAVTQSLLLLGTGKLLFDIQITGDYLSLFAMVTLGSLAFLSLGFLISGISRNVETSNILANAIAFPMLFLSGVFFPIDSAPSWMQPIANALPLTYLANGLRDIMIDGDTLMRVWQAVAVLVSTAAIGLLLSLRFFRWDARNV